MFKNVHSELNLNYNAWQNLITVAILALLASLDKDCYFYLFHSLKTNEKEQKEVIAYAVCFSKKLLALIKQNKWSHTFQPLSRFDCIYKEINYNYLKCFENLNKKLYGEIFLFPCACPVFDAPAVFCRAAIDCSYFC